MKGRFLFSALSGLMLALTAPAALAQDESSQSRCADGDRDVEIVTRTPPIWPMSAGLLCVEGHVRLEFIVGTTGQTRDIRVIESSAPGVFDRNAIDAVAGWRFLPRCKDGELVEREASQTIQFELPPDQAESCPETIPEDLLDLTIAIAAIYSAFADVLLESGGGPLALVDLQPSLDGDPGRIEQLHIDSIHHQIRVLNSEHQQEFLAISNRLMDFSRLAADEDFSETRRLADAHSAALERTFELDQRLQRELMASARTIRESVVMSDENWDFLVGRFLRSGPEDREGIEIVRTHFDEVLSLLRLLHERRDGWRSDPDNPYTPVVFDPELARLANGLQASINRTASEMTTAQMEWLLGWSQL